MDSPSKGLVSGALRDNEQEERIGAIERRLGGSILTQTDEQRAALENKLATGTQATKDKIAAFRTYAQTHGRLPAARAKGAGVRGRHIRGRMT